MVPGMNGNEILSDPLRAIQALEPAEIERRLDELEGQARALKVLLRSARRAQASGDVQKRQPASPKGGPPNAA
jgi:hypothetical protein